MYFFFNLVSIFRFKIYLLPSQKLRALVEVDLLLVIADFHHIQIFFDLSSNQLQRIICFNVCFVY